MNVIKQRRLELGLTLEQVGEVVGVRKSTVQKWESGMIENMKRDKIALLSKALEISPLIIMQEAFLPELDYNQFESIQKMMLQMDKSIQREVYRYVEKKLHEQNQKLKKSEFNNDYFTSQEQVAISYHILNIPSKIVVNIDGTLLAGELCMNQEKKHIQTAMVEYVPPIFDFAFEVRGNSMFPTFHDNEIVFVKKTSDIYNGMIAAIEINGKTFLKKLYIKANKIRLVSFNPQIDEIGNRKFPDFFIEESDNFRVIGKVLT
ncbi:MAG: LexA family transcriptional regulator [Streptococcaceae bacterium]|jgi:SOS-response transcriptional repressor LexA|nr:LexA family transcriptional regulator [Streptococcaceae bacterium]